jgi:hypothetical protein
MIYNYISVKQVIAKVLADLDLDEESLRISDMREWASEAVEKIGSVRQLNRKVSGVGDTEILKIVDNQVSLPYDLFRLNTVAYSSNPLGPWFPMTVSAGSFNVWSSSPSDNTDGFSISDNTLIDLTQELYRKVIENPVYAWFSKMDRQTAIDILNTDSNIRTILTNIIKMANAGAKKTELGLKYSIKPGYINTNIKDGYLKLSYDAILTDNDGYPMIPDLMSYIEAIYWYITMKLKYPEYLAGRINREIYYDIRRSWNFYSKQAYGEAMMPSQDEMETIKNNWNKLIPDYNADKSFYGNLDQPEKIKNFNR